MSNADLHIAFDAFLALCAMEGIVKPVAIYATGLVLKVVDRYIGVVPDWLYRRGS
jgi:hypothetical protein